MDGSSFDEPIVLAEMVVVLVVVGTLAGAMKMMHARQFSISWKDPLVSSLQRRLLATRNAVDRIRRNDKPIENM